MTQKIAGPIHSTNTEQNRGKCKIVENRYYFLRYWQFHGAQFLKKIGLMIAQLAKKFIFLNVTDTWILVLRKALLSVRRTERILPTFFPCVTF